MDPVDIILRWAREQDWFEEIYGKKGAIMTKRQEKLKLEETVKKILRKTKDINFMARKLGELGLYRLNQDMANMDTELKIIRDQVFDSAYGKVDKE